MTLLAVGLGSLLTVVAVSAVAGIGITAIYSLALLGMVRSQESGRSGQPGLRVAWGLVATIALLVFAAVLIQGIRIVAG